MGVYYFDRLGAQLNKKLQTRDNWFLVDCHRLVNQDVPRFRIQSSKSCKIFLKKIAHYYLQFKRFIEKYFLPCAVILIITSEHFKLMDWLKT